MLHNNDYDYDIELIDGTIIPSNLISNLNSNLNEGSIVPYTVENKNVHDIVSLGENKNLHDIVSLDEDINKESELILFGENDDRQTLSTPNIPSEFITSNNLEVGLHK